MTKYTRIQSSLAIMTGVILSLGLFLPGVVNAQQEDRQRGRPAEVTERIEERKSATKEMIAEKRETAQVKSTEARMAACEKRQAKITSAMSRISAQATKHVGTFDKIYERVQKFYDKGQLTVDNYDELNAEVAEAQAAATLEASVLSELNVEVDCENPDVAGTVATYRDSAQAAKESLKAYRSTLVDLISSLKAEAPQQNDDESEDTSNDSDETTEPEAETTPTETEGAN